MLVVSCEHGCEDLLMEELRELGYSSEYLKPSKVLVESKDFNDAIRLNFFLRQANRVFVLLFLGEVRTLGDIEKFSESLDYSAFMLSEQTFAVRGVREGNHNFTSMDIARVVGSSIVEHFLSEKGARVRANLKEPDVEFYAELSGEQFIITLNTSGESLHKRYKRPFQHFAPIKPTIASSMIRLSSFFSRRNLLDPMAGGGTIPEEACLAAKNVPAGYFRKSYAFQRLGFLDSGLLEKLKDSAEKKIRKCDVRICSADRFRKNLNGMRMNFEAVGVGSELFSCLGNAETLDYIGRGEYSLVVTNPPFGLRIANPSVVRRLYEKFPKAAAKKGIEEIVMLTPKRRVVAQCLENAGYEISHCRRILYGRLESFIVKAVNSRTIT